MLKKVVLISLTTILIIGLVIFGFITWQTKTIIVEMADTRIEKNSELIQKYSSLLDRIETQTSGGIKISAWRFKAQNPGGIVIVLHGMHGQDASSLLDFGYFFMNANYEAFCLDMRAHGYSGGDTIGFGYTEVRDVSALLDWLKERPEYKDKKIILYGISMGGATALNTAAVRKDIDLVISVSAFKSFENTFLDFMRAEEIPELIVKTFKPAIRLVLALKYGTNPVKNSPINRIRLLDIPVLLVHGDQDEQILVQQARDLKQAAGDNAELWIVKDAEHMVVTDLLNEDKSWYREKILSFIKSNLSASL